MNRFKTILEKQQTEQCPRQFLLALTDTMNVVNGKWKLPIIAALLYKESRFKDLKERFEKITPRMLSRELKELEINGIIEKRFTEPHHCNMSTTYLNQAKTL